MRLVEGQMSILIQNNKFPPKSEPCYENKTHSKKTEPCYENKTHSKKTEP